LCSAGQRDTPERISSRFLVVVPSYRNVLRGRDVPLEQSLGILAMAVKEEFPAHMVRRAVGAIVRIP